VLVQAAAAGRPVVTFACDGAREVVEHGVNGYVVPMKDAAAVAEALLPFVRDPVLRKQLGSAGKKMVNESWRVETMVEQIDELYRRLIAGVK
jgi:glycosyltransferase involved in cell wall biosynthesis